MSMIRRAAASRLASPEKLRTSPSSMKSTSTLPTTRRSASLLPSIQKFIVSSATSLGLSAIWSSTDICSSGSMLARKR